MISPCFCYQLAAIAIIKRFKEFWQNWPRAKMPRNTFTPDHFWHGAQSWLEHSAGFRRTLSRKLTSLGGTKPNRRKSDQNFELFSRILCSRVQPASTKVTQKITPLALATEKNYICKANSSHSFFLIYQRKLPILPNKRIQFNDIKQKLRRREG